MIRAPGKYTGRANVGAEIYENTSLDGVTGVMSPADLRARLDAFGSSIEIAAVVAIAALANLLIASAAGTFIPLGMRRLGLDPALASSIFLMLITDVVGFGGFLLVANLLL